MEMVTMPDIEHYFRRLAECGNLLLPNQMSNNNNLLTSGFGVSRGLDYSIYELIHSNHRRYASLCEFPHISCSSHHIVLASLGYLDWRSLASPIEIDVLDFDPSQEIIIFVTGPLQVCITYGIFLLNNDTPKNERCSAETLHRNR